MRETDFGRITGIVRILDEVGRLTIPIEYQRTLNIERDDPVEFYYNDRKQTIGVRKYYIQACVFCRSCEQLKNFKGFYVCKPCLESLPSMYEPKVQPIIERPPKKRNPEKLNRTKRNPEKLNRTLMRIQKVVKENPNITQKKLAQIVGITQSRVSQLKKIIMENNNTP